jgi:PAS domain S-box-containing protein
MKEYKILGLSVIFFIVVCLTDAVFESLVFHERSFWNSAVLDLSGHAILLRSMVAISFLIFGLIVSRAFFRQRHSEEELLLEKEKFQSLIEGVPFGMIIVGADGSFHYLNPKFKQLFGYDLNDIPNGREWFRRAHPDPVYRHQVISDWIAELERIEIGLSVGHTYTVKCKDSTEKTVLFKPVTVSAGKYVVTCEDITERTKAEEETRRTKTLLDSIVQNLPTPVFLKDAQELTFILWNRANEELYGFARDEVIGKTVHDFFPKEQADRFDAQDRETLMSGQLLCIPEQMIRTRRKGTRIVHTKKLPILEDGRPRYLLGISEDITERKEAEQALVNAREAAEKASFAKSEFLANMSHEIRTPINGIMGMTELALNTELTPEQTEYLDAIRISADSLLKLINDILDFSKIEAGKLELIDVEFGLRDTIGDAITMLAVQAHDKNLELLYHIPPEVPDAVTGDPGRLRQILVNLVGNAIKFTEKGEIVIRVDSASETQSDVFLHFTVADTGIGIPPDKQEKIFSAFEQADTSTSRKYGGTGLGLAISSRFSQLMGGKLWVESEVGKGSTFHFTVRLHLQSDRVAPRVAEEISSLKDLPVLVVDDNATNRKIIEQILVYWEMKPTVVDSGRAALAAMKMACDEGRPFPVVLTDCMMPEMDGFELVERINEDPRLAPSGIVMLTSAGQRGDAARCLDLGIAAYLVKPFKQSDLLFTISRVLQGPPDSQERPALITRHSIRESRRRLRVLLAEDNPVNQKLAVKMLERMGHTVSVVGSGTQVLETLEEADFDLILMDVQMPVMDGLEATKAIREREKAVTKGHIPVIAMTAYAMKGDRERCLEAGMDGYISKPIKAQELYETIEHTMRNFEKDGKREPVAATSSPVLDKTRILDRVEGDVELLKEIMALFLEDYPGLLSEIREAFQQGDPERLEKAAHALKGSVANFTAEAAVQAALKVETVGRSRDLTEAPQAIQDLEREIDRVREELVVLDKEIKL